MQGCVLAGTFWVFLPGLGRSHGPMFSSPLNIHAYGGSPEGWLPGARQEVPAGWLCDGEGWVTHPLWASVTRHVRWGQTTEIIVSHHLSAWTLAQDSQPPTQPSPDCPSLRSQERHVPSQCHSICICKMGPWIVPASGVMWDFPGGSVVKYSPAMQAT